MNPVVVSADALPFAFGFALPLGAGAATAGADDNPELLDDAAVEVIAHI